MSLPNLNYKIALYPNQTAAAAVIPRKKTHRVTRTREKEHRMRKSLDARACGKCTHIRDEYLSLSCGECCT